MPRENHRERAGDSERSVWIPRRRFIPYGRPRLRTDARPVTVTAEQARHARERLRQLSVNLGQRAENAHAEAAAADSHRARDAGSLGQGQGQQAAQDQEYMEIWDSITTIGRYRWQRRQQREFEQGRRRWQEREELRQRREQQRQRERTERVQRLRLPDYTPSLGRLLDIISRQPQEPTSRPLIANAPTEMASAPAPSADGEPTWEFEDWFDGEYLDQLVSEFLHLEDQELVEEVTRQVEQLSLASDLTQEVAGLDEQPVLTQDPTVSSEGPMVNGNVPAASGLNEEPNGERQGDDSQLPQ